MPGGSLSSITSAQTGFGLPGPLLPFLMGRSSPTLGELSRNGGQNFGRMELEKIFIISMILVILIDSGIIS
jgi:hypothetical protein